MTTLVLNPTSVVATTLSGGATWGGVVNIAGAQNGTYGQSSISAPLPKTYLLTLSGFPGLDALPAGAFITALTLRAYMKGSVGSSAPPYSLSVTNLGSFPSSLTAFNIPAAFDWVTIPNDVYIPPEYGIASGLSVSLAFAYSGTTQTIYVDAFELTVEYDLPATVASAPGVSATASSGAASAKGQARASPSGVPALPSLGATTLVGHGAVAAGGTAVLATVGVCGVGAGARALPSGCAGAPQVGQAAPSATGLAASGALAATAAVGNGAVSGLGRAQPLGVAATLAQGSAAASALVPGQASPAGVLALAAMGSPSASVPRSVAVAGLSAAAALGAAAASLAVRPTPAGVSATTGRGSVAATGQAVAVPPGSAAVAALGTASVSGVLTATAAPWGVECLASLGDAALSVDARTLATGVGAAASSGAARFPPLWLSGSVFAYAL